MVRVERGLWLLAFKAQGERVRARGRAMRRCSRAGRSVRHDADLWRLLSTGRVRYGVKVGRYS